MSQTRTDVVPIFIDRGAPLCDFSGDVHLLRHRRSIQPVQTTKHTFMDSASIFDVRPFSQRFLKTPTQSSSTIAMLRRATLQRHWSGQWPTPLCHLHDERRRRSHHLGEKPHEKGNITKFQRSLKKPPKSDWRAFDAMSEEQRHRAALSDPDAPPATAERLARATPRSFCAGVAKETEAHQEQFASRLHLPLGTVRDREQGAHPPDKAAQIPL